MTYFHPAWLEHQRKRYLRADAYRFAAPGTPEAIPPGWLDPSATRVRLKEAQEEEARKQAAQEVIAWEARQRELLEIRRELDELKCEYARQQRTWEAACAERKRRADVAWERFMAAFMRGDFRQKANFNPDQPRVPAGNADGGQWTSGAQSGQANSDEQSPEPQPTRLAQYSFGTLVGQSRVRGGGWICFYKFSFGTIMAPGPTNFKCPSWVRAAGVSHGKLIANDN